MIIIKPEDWVVAFWFAEDKERNNFRMTLRKYPDYWQLDWWFYYSEPGCKETHYEAIASNFTPEAEVLAVGHSTFELTKLNYPLRRTWFRVDGYQIKLYQMYKQYKLLDER
ncbi:hypothetical protein LCGC14_2383930 [marine sediment metagenome]|uniref:Uncharacterized protein n=1 Tax=marine sediment metagenome TaxID=412755 RepID=A0A0F9ECG0_9ZZZZ